MFTLKFASKTAMALAILQFFLLPSFYAQTDSAITLEDIWYSRKFNPSYVWGLTSMQDGVHYTTLSTDRESQVITKFSYETGEAVGVIFNSSMLGDAYRNIQFDSYQFAAEEKKLILTYNTESIYRHSTAYQLLIFDLETKKTTTLPTTESIRVATLSPDGQQLAYCQNNNIFVYNLTDATTLQITTDGEYNKIINGTTDWVYEEEFGFEKALAWSPNGEYLAFMRTDESQVKEYTLPYYGELYPVNYTYKYPKAGEENAKVSLHMYHLKSNQHKAIDLNQDFEYIPRMQWTSTNQLAFYTLNRKQNELKLFVASANTPAQLIYSEKSETYIEITDNTHFLPSGFEAVLTSERQGFNHILYLNFKNINKPTTQWLTNGNWEVTKVYGIGEKREVYFQAAKSSPLNREIYSTNLKGQLKTVLATEGTNDAEFTANFKFFVNTHSSFQSPPTFSVYSNSGKLIRVIESNESFKQALHSVKFCSASFTQFKAADGSMLNAYQILPADFKPNTKYPVLMYVYGGPGSQTVQNQWGGKNYLWFQMLAQEGYVIVSVDGRGTGARGYQFRTSTYKNLGALESDDQIAVAKQLQNLPFVDASRIGIFGWSYGGYLSSLCLTKGSDVFKAAIAVAPVTNWRFYDSIYTERYMDLPQDNADGYDKNAPLHFASQLKGNLLLVHGTADDNVHPQNAFEYSDLLVQLNLPFDQMYYTNKNHGIYGGTTRLHLFTKMTNWLKVNL